jgi:tetraacyldisaccharide-1-P 4'-kinase
MTLLAIISKIYSFCLLPNENFFEIFGFLVYKPKAKVVSVGNISMGPAR